MRGERETARGRGKQRQQQFIQGGHGNGKEGEAAGAVKEGWESRGRKGTGRLNGLR